MTDAKTQTARYEIIPGISAYRSWRITSVLTTIVFIAGILPFFLFRNDHLLEGRNAGEYWVLYLAPIPVAIAICVVFFTWASRRAKAENAAGYTTRTSGYTQFDQVNPTTGDVIRRAGSAVLTVPNSRGGTDDSVETDAVGDSPTGTPRFTGKSMSGRYKVLAWVSGIVILLVIAVPAYAGFDFVTGTIFFLSFVVGLALLVFIVFAAVVGYFRGYLKSAKLARPDAFIFLTTVTPELQQAAASAGVVIPSQSYCAVAIGAGGLELWGRKPSIDPATTLAWSSVLRVQPGKLLVSNSNSRSFAAQTLHVFRQLGGEQLDFPFPIFGPRSMAYASPDDANKVLDVVARYARIAD